jgi:hypothetical protein
MNQYADFQAECRRLAILVILGEAAAYTQDEVVLRVRLQGRGHPVSVQALRDDLKLLRDLDCVRLETPGGVWLATLTRTGDDVARGLAEVDGVARPVPGA